MAQLARTCIFGRYEEQEENLRIAVIRCTMHELPHSGLSCRSNQSVQWLLLETSDQGCGPGYPILTR